MYFYAMSIINSHTKFVLKILLSEKHFFKNAKAMLKGLSPPQGGNICILLPLMRQVHVIQIEISYCHMYCLIDNPQYTTCLNKVQ